MYIIHNAFIKVKSFFLSSHFEDIYIGPLLLKIRLSVIKFIVISNELTRGISQERYTAAMHCMMIIMAGFVVTCNSSSRQHIFAM